MTASSKSEVSDDNAWKTSTESVQVPVKGEDTVHIDASVKDGNAEVKEISSADIDKINSNAATGAETTTVTIDLSGAKGDKVSIKADDTKTSDLNTTQQAAIKSMEVVNSFEAHIESNGTTEKFSTNVSNGKKYTKVKTIKGAKKIE